MKSLLSSTYNTRSIVINGKESNVYRSDKLDFCSVEDFNILLDLGINLFIDLRNLENKQINPILNSSNVKFLNIAFKYDKSLFESGNESEENQMAKYYLLLVQQYNLIKKIFDNILMADNKIIINCAFGRDRTGVISFLIQSVCGAQDDEIIEEYALTDKIYCSLKLENSFKLKKYVNYEMAKLIMKDFLLLFRKEYGSVENYFELIGFSLNDIVTIKSKIINCQING